MTWKRFDRTNESAAVAAVQLLLLTTSNLYLLSRWDGKVCSHFRENCLSAPGTICLAYHKMDTVS